MAALMTVFIIALILYYAQNYIKSKKTIDIEGFKISQTHLVCKSCGHVGEPVIARGGSMILTLFLILITFGIALIYYLFRSGNKKKVCAQCGSSDLVPPTSPVGRQLIRSLSRPEFK